MTWDDLAATPDLREGGYGGKVATALDVATTAPRYRYAERLAEAMGYDPVGFAPDTLRALWLMVRALDDILRDGRRTETQHVLVARAAVEPDEDYPAPSCLVAVALDVGCGPQPVTGLLRDLDATLGTLITNELAGRVRRLLTEWERHGHFGALGPAPRNRDNRKRH